MGRKKLNCLCLQMIWPYKEKNPKISTKKTLDLINEFTKLQYTESAYKYLLHFYTPIMKYLKKKFFKNPIYSSIKNCKKLLEESRRKAPWLWSWKWFFGYDTKSTSNKSKKLISGTVSNWKGSAQQKKQSTKWKLTYGMGEDIWEPSIW